nr:Wzy polymerase domain-containing protein [Pseudomonas luteola]
MSIFIFLLSFAPFVLPFHFYPDGDLINNFLSLLLGCAFLFFSFKRPKQKINLMFVFFLVFSVLIFFFGNLEVLSGRLYCGALLFLFLTLLACALNVYMSECGVERYSELILWGVALGGLLNIVIAALQFFSFDFLPSWVYLSPYSLGEEQKSIYGNLAQRNLFTQYCFIGAIALLVLLRNRKYLLVYTCSFSIFFGFVISAAGSRSALLYLTLIAFLALMCIFKTASAERGNRNFFKSTLYFCAISFIFQLLSPLLKIETGFARMSGGGGSRLTEWSKASRIIIDNFPFGVGWGNYIKESFFYKLSGMGEGGEENWNNAHNIFIHLASEVGVFAVLVFIILFLAVFYAFRTYYKSAHGYFMSAAVLMIFIHSNLEYPLFYINFLMLFVLLAAGIFYQCSKVFSFSISFSMRVFLQGGAVLGLCAIAATLFGYFRLVQMTYPSHNYDENLVRISEISRLGANPFLKDSSNLTLLNYIKTGTLGWESARCHVAKMASDNPAYTLLDKLAVYSFIIEDYSFGERVLRSRFKAYGDARTEDLNSDLDGFSLVERKKVDFYVDKARQPGAYYKLEIPPGCE